MTRQCPHCQAAVEPGDSFCVGCGARLMPEQQAPARAEPRWGSPAARVEPAGMASASREPPPGSEVLVEVETNRPYLRRHASLLRFRVTNMRPEAACDVTIRMCLQGQGRFVEQEARDREQTCRLRGLGDPHIFALAFWPLEAGEISVEDLRVTVQWIHGGEPVALELPDRSLFVSVTDPALAKDSPNVVISGGIHIDIHELRDVYGSDVDIENILSINAQREAASGQAGIAWQPIRLRRAERKPLPAELRIVLPGGTAIDLRRIPAGAFTMGSPDGEGRDDEHPAHRVRIARDFYLAKYPVTQAQHQALMGANPSKFPISARHPVDNVSWDDAREFCRRLRAHLAGSCDALSEPSIGLEDVALPSEAEWEYACRAGSETLFSFGDDRRQLEGYGWFDKNSNRTTHPVGQLKPNAWGLYDVHGSVWEWCGDRHAPDYVGCGGDDPQGPVHGDRRVLRGGSWSCYARDCRSARRHAVAPGERTANYGFRVVLRVNSPR